MRTKAPSRRRSAIATLATALGEHGALELADDAVELDTTGLDVAYVVDRIASVARERGLA